MSDPTFSWNDIAATQTDADSIVDEILMEALRQNQIRLNVLGTPGGVISVRNADQTIPTASPTVVFFNTEDVDSNNEFNTSTYKWTPTVEGLYACHVNLQWDASTDQVDFTAGIYKNSVLHPNSTASMFERASGTTSQNHSLFGIVDVNGTTDFIQIVVQQNQGADRGLNANFARWIGYRVGYNSAL